MNSPTPFAVLLDRHTRPSLTRIGSAHSSIYVRGVLLVERRRVFQRVITTVSLTQHESSEPPTVQGIETALSMPEIEVRIFGKPSTRVHRRLGVVLAYGAPEADTDVLRAHAKTAAECIAL